MSAESEELYSLLVPLSEDRLIVPRACVAEVVRFSFEVDDNKGEARLENGILRLTLPRAEADKPKRIEVKTA